MPEKRTTSHAPPFNLKRTPSNSSRSWTLMLAIIGCFIGTIVGALPGLVGSIQTLEVIKLIMGVGETLTSRMLLIDALTMELRQFRLPRDPDCPVCARR